jgi:hypothetical protein
MLISIARMVVVTGVVVVVPTPTKAKPGIISSCNPITLMAMVERRSSGFVHVFKLLWLFFSYGRRPSYHIPEPHG